MMIVLIGITLTLSLAQAQQCLVSQPVTSEAVGCDVKLFSSSNNAQITVNGKNMISSYTRGFAVAHVDLSSTKGCYVPSVHYFNLYSSSSDHAKFVKYIQEIEAGKRVLIVTKERIHGSSSTEFKKVIDVLKPYGIDLTGVGQRDNIVAMFTKGCNKGTIFEKAYGSTKGIYLEHSFM